MPVDYLKRTEFRRFLDALGGGDGEPRLPAVPRL